ncbi:BglG family transcriptional antiterminator [Mesocricetibacter intestinalis]|uniref:BglG family transcriptional antiterminator n=1 Tax=Mesocricetibacter intestinalis TaxID=1521930 RepID=A0A4R6VG48_9PAST|nr:PRD domain-containing protein [Mesocricetibacter intestinalis]TDQ59852.1 BglG family transcriptional antiterminator [Mesocricetibacter intestinalis]
MLIISKVFNNNAAQVKNERGTELVILGKGIAFGKKAGDSLSEKSIEKIFTLNNDPFTIRLTEILSEIPPEFFQLTNQIVKYANQQLKTRLSNSIYVSLTDHLYHAVIRINSGARIQNGLSFVIQRLYKQEFTVGKYAVALINKSMKLEMDDDEAGFIALHIFNARTDSNTMKDTYRTTRIIKDILNLISYHFKLKLDESSHDYARFITHLQYFSRRLFAPAQPGRPDNILYKQTKSAYPNAYRCIAKIEKYLSQNFDKSLTDDEHLYLALHIQRVIYRTK